MSSQDPLTLLRDAIISNTLPTLLDSSSNPTTALPQASSLSFSPDLTLPLTTPTRFTTRLNDASELLTLQQIYYVYLGKDASSADYMRNANVGGGFRPVGLLDRRIVLEYLTGGQVPVGRVLVEGSKPEEGVFEGDITPKAAQDLSSDIISSQTHVSSSAQAGTAIGSGYIKRKYEVNEIDKEAVKKIKAQEIALADKYDSLRVAPGGKKTDFTALRRAIMDERVKPLRDQVRAAASSSRSGANKENTMGRSKSSASASTSSTTTDINRAKKQRSTQQNIILLSSSPTSLVSMWNVKRFLEEGVFERTEDARARQVESGNKKMEDVVVIYRTVKGPDGEDKKIKYYAIDNVEVLYKLAGAGGNDPWDRVIAVFTTGQTWQFKSYKWQDPKELFKHVRGIYMHFTNDPINPVVEDWKVTSFGIHPQQRHTDRPIVTSFWHMVEGVGSGVKR